VDQPILAFDGLHYVEDEIRGQPGQATGGGAQVQVQRHPLDLPAQLPQGPAHGGRLHQHVLLVEAGAWRKAAEQERGFAPAHFTGSG
jgi:hypothetical protein